jgi:tetratricopeptide (TPR) repeat protein
MGWSFPIMHPTIIALFMLSAAIKAAPGFPGYRWLHGTCLLRLGRYKEALPELKMSYRPSDKPEHQSTVFHLIATCYAQLQDWPNAVKAYDNLSRMPYSRYDPQVMNDLARAYGMASEYEKSRAERKFAIRYGYADPDQAFQQCDDLFQNPAHYTLAINLAINSAINVDPTKQWLFAGRALADSKTDLPDKAGKDLQSVEALKKKPTKPKLPDVYEYVLNKNSPSSDFLAKLNSDRRNQILAAASKLQSAAAPAKVK